MLRLIFLICNLMVIASYPAYASPLSEFAKAHNVEFIAAGCLVMGVIGSIGGMLYPLPDDDRLSGLKRMMARQLAWIFYGSVRVFGSKSFYHADRYRTL